MDTYSSRPISSHEITELVKKILKCLISAQKDIWYGAILQFLMDKQSYTPPKYAVGDVYSDYECDYLSFRLLSVLFRPGIEGLRVCKRFYVYIQKVEATLVEPSKKQTNPPFSWNNTDSMTIGSVPNPYRYTKHPTQTV